MLCPLLPHPTPLPFQQSVLNSFALSDNHLLVWLWHIHIPGSSQELLAQPYQHTPGPEDFYTQVSRLSGWLENRVGRWKEGTSRKKPKNIPMPLALSGLVVPPKVLGNSKILMTAAPNSKEAEVLVGHFLAWLSSGEKTYSLNNMDKPTFWKFLQKVKTSFSFWRNESIPLFYGFYKSYIFFSLYHRAWVIILTLWINIFVIKQQKFQPPRKQQSNNTPPSFL